MRCDSISTVQRIYSCSCVMSPNPFFSPMCPSWSISHPDRLLLHSRCVSFYLSLASFLSLYLPLPSPRGRVSRRVDGPVCRRGLTWRYPISRRDPVKRRFCAVPHSPARRGEMHDNSCITALSAAVNQRRRAGALAAW